MVTNELVRSAIDVVYTLQRLIVYQLSVNTTPPGVCPDDPVADYAISYESLASRLVDFTVDLGHFVCLYILFHKPINYVS